MDATFWLVSVLFLVILGSSWTAGGSNHEWRLKRLDRKVDLILSHLGLDPNQGVSPQLMELVKAGQKIQAIKVYREQTGAGLKEDLLSRECVVDRVAVVFLLGATCVICLHKLAGPLVYRLST